jgi:hypothetical protein
MKKKGFTLLFASLIVSLLLAVGLAILNITLQQLLLSSTAKESQFAFYNADTGVECALYYDKNNPSGKIFATSTLSANYISSAADISCNGVNGKNVGVVSSDGGSAETDFDLLFIAPECPSVTNMDKMIHVRVLKTADSVGNINTVISSYGYNTCDPNNPKRVERGFQTAY